MSTAASSNTLIPDAYQIPGCQTASWACAFQDVGQECSGKHTPESEERIEIGHLPAHPWPLAAPCGEWFARARNCPRAAEGATLGRRAVAHPCETAGRGEGWAPARALSRPTGGGGPHLPLL